MYKLGITGGIGSGKTTACLFFKEKGAFIFDADIEAKKLLKNMNQKLNHVIVMDVPDNLIIERLSNRRSCKSCGQLYNLLFEPPSDISKCNKCNGELYQRTDDNPETIQQRLSVYHDQTKPVINHYKTQKITKLINSEGTIEGIKKDIINNITN